MANRYWVGSTGTWTTIGVFANTNWATSSGGGGGASSPSPSDDVFFDVNSNAFTCTVTILTATCASLNVIGLNKRLTLNLGTLYVNTLTVYGGINVALTATNFNYTSNSPGWTSTTYNAFTTTNFIKIGLTATLITYSTSSSISMRSQLGASNIGEPLVITSGTAIRLALYSSNIGEAPIPITTYLTTSLAFTSNYPLSLPATPVRAIEKFGINSSNTITPIPYQFWG